MYTGHCSFLNIVHAILPCEQAGPKDPLGRRYGEKADLPMMVGGIAPSDTHTGLILKLKFEAPVRIADYG